MIAKEGLPRFYIRCLVQVEDMIAASLADKELRNKLSTTNARSLNAMKLKYQKYVAAHTDEMKAYREVYKSFSILCCRFDARLES